MIDPGRRSCRSRDSRPHQVGVVYFQRRSNVGFDFEARVIGVLYFRTRGYGDPGAEFDLILHERTGEVLSQKSRIEAQTRRRLRVILRDSITDAPDDLLSIPHLDQVLKI